jgi:hypothetical protein
MGKREYGNFLLKPLQWANKQWEQLPSIDPRNKLLSCIKRISLIIPLYLIKAVGKLLAYVRLGVNGVIRSWYKVHAEDLKPMITYDEWGKIGVERRGKLENYKDVALTPRRAEAWDWDWNKQAGTMHHSPGIRQIDIDHYLLSSPHIPEVVILSQGRGHGGGKDNPGPGVLQVDPGLESYLLSKGVKQVHILKTAAAIEKYKECGSNGWLTAALIHTTC